MPSLKKPRKSAQQFLLQAIDLYNWGAFAGRHHAELDARGSAIIGPTGCGKTTVVDALMTLLTERPQYNLASTGGHESDRDLMSYIRGVSGAGNDADNRHIARPDKTTTAISATFADENGNQCLEIAAIFWLENASNAAADRKDVWLVSENSDENLNEWLAIHHESGVRALKKHIKSLEKIKISDTKKAYLGHVRRFFEVGDNAFNLLNRAVGLKQLNSVDDIFRRLVLEDHSAFNRAASVVKEFDDLTAIRQELDTARTQLETLKPIAEQYGKQQQLTENITRQAHVLALLPTWFALSAARLWGDYARVCEAQVVDNEARLNTLEHTLDTQQTLADNLRERYLQVGGSNIEMLQQLIATQKATLKNIEKAAQDYQRLTQQLQRDNTLSASQLAHNQDWAREKISEQSAQLSAQKDRLYDLGATRRQRQQQVNELSEEIEGVKAHRSNIPVKFQRFRSILAAHLNVNDDDLPFVAELIEVKPEDSDWRGAIERAIGAHRLRILVAPTLMQTALRFVNDRNNHVHVRLRVAEKPSTMPTFMDDGFTRKLLFNSAHPHIDALKQLLADIDRHCVASPEELAHTPHAMTMQGLMSNKSGYFDKQDQKPLHADWLTGFDNRDRLAQLDREWQDQNQALKVANSDFHDAEKQLIAQQQHIVSLETLRDLDFDRIDLPNAEAKLAAWQQQWEAHQRPDSDTAKAKADFEQQQKKVSSAQEAVNNAKVQIKLLKNQHDNAKNQLTRAEARTGKGLSSEDNELAQAHLDTPTDSDRESLDALENRVQKRLNAEFNEANNQRHELENVLIRAMEKAQQADTGALTEAGTELRDVSEYLFRLKVLSEEDLPAKQQRFLDYLNNTSDQGVTQLLTTVDNEINAIETRIAALNDTLKAVDFQPNRYLQLKPQRVTHQSLRDLQNAQRRLRTQALKDDAGESHYFALKQLVGLLQQAIEKKTTLSARALLDARYRLQFSIANTPRDETQITHEFKGSQGGSGGEKEIIASYILTASLSYALSPRVGEPPRFSTIVLDEAFSKSSQAVAGRIIDALRQFGLHPLFVTPNKEMRLLREHTRSAILVYRKDELATMTTMTWEALAESARRFQS